MKVFTEQEVVQILNHVRNDLHEPYYAGDGTQEPVPPLVAMRIAIDRVYDAFGLDAYPPPASPYYEPPRATGSLTASGMIEWIEKWGKSHEDC